MESIESNETSNNNEIQTKEVQNENIDFTNESNSDNMNEVSSTDGLLQCIQDKPIIDNEKLDQIVELNEVDNLVICQDISSDNESQNSIELIQSQNQQMHQMLIQRDELIALQKRELELLEKEKSAIKRNYELSQKDKESAVVRYAMVEKNIIDLKTANDLANKKLKESQKESEALTARLKFVLNERDRSNKELRKISNHCDGLKNDLTMLESKHKWCPVKLKQELAEKAALEARVTELGQQVTQLNEYRQQNIDSIKYEEKAVEAQLILLKHKCEEKDKENAVLTTKLAQLTTEFDDLTSKFKSLNDDYEKTQIQLENSNRLITDAEELCRKQEEMLKDLSKKFEETQILLKEELILNEEATSELHELKQIRATYQEQLQETAKIRLREENLMSLTKELTEKSVSIESKLILSNSKSIALEIENKKIKEIYEKHKNRILDLENELIKFDEKQKNDLSDIHQAMSEKDALNDDLKLKLDNSLDELEATKRKHAQIIKELNRELMVMRGKLDPKPEKAGTNRGDEIKEPSKKSLIDRIVRLQRALARQTEKNEFLENHCAALINKLKAKG